jgi:formylmethanofuran dehydrogenase subunit E
MTPTTEDLQDIENNTCEDCGEITPWLAEEMTGWRTLCSGCFDQHTCGECGQDFRNYPTPLGCACEVALD